MTTTYIQTGDLLYKRINKLPKDLEEVKTGVIVHSDATNHTHRVCGGKLLTDKNRVMFVEVQKESTLTHEEHSTLGLPQGNWKIEIVREYDHFEEEARNVID